MVYFFIINCSSHDYLICSSVAIDPHAWLHLLHKLELEPHLLIAEATDKILAVIFEGVATQPDQSRSSIRTLLSVGKEGIVEGVVSEVCRVLGASEVISVTTEEMEIFSTPPTKLWHPQLWKE